MKKTSIATFIFGAFLLASAPAATAQSSLGVNVGYNVDNEEFFAGGQFRYGLTAFPITINPIVETYFIDNLTFLQIDLNALYHIGRQYTTTFTPYFGAGLGINYLDTDFGDGETDAGLNLIAGADFGQARIRPFVEARIQINEGTPVIARGGVLFTL